MAMELDIIKTDTTWNDAAASLNNNFGKVKQAIAMGGGSGSIIVDSEMSDTSTNPVQNKVVKQYVDDAETKAKKYTDEKISQIEVGGGSIIVDTEMSDTSENAVQNKVIKKYIDDYDVYLEGYAEQQAIDAEKAAKQYTDEKIAQIEIDTSNFATKDELNNLTNEVIANEEVHAAALNDLNERKADKEYVENALKNIDTSDLATKEEVQNLTDEIITNEEVHAASLNDLNERKADKDDIPTKVSQLTNDSNFQTETEVFGTVLYNVDVANTNYGAVTLSDSTANYEFVDFYAATNDKHVFFNRVYQPNGKKITFTGVLVGNTSLFLKAKVYECNGNKLTTAKGTNDLVWAGEWGSEKNSLERRENTVGIWRVVGYKR